MERLDRDNGRPLPGVRHRRVRPQGPLLLDVGSRPRTQPRGSSMSSQSALWVQPEGAVVRVARDDVRRHGHGDRRRLLEVRRRRVDARSCRLGAASCHALTPPRANLCLAASPTRIIFNPAAARPTSITPMRSVSAITSSTWAAVDGDTDAVFICRSADDARRGSKVEAACHSSDQIAQDALGLVMFADEYASSVSHLCHVRPGQKL